MSKEFDIKDVQALILDILRYFKTMCDENGLKYYLAYGTLIGAVRHQGFIPWDDDVDVHMPRDDFKKLVQIMKENPHPYYRLVCRENNPEFTAPLPKLVDSRTRLTQSYGFIEKVELGVYIDIFLLDGAGKSKEEGYEYYKDAYKLYKHWNRADTMMFPQGKNKFVSLLKWIKHVPEKAKGIYYWLDKIEEHNSKQSFYDCDFIGALEAGTPQAERNVWPRSYFEDAERLMFEGTEFRVPCNYDAVLRGEYGDYMKLPPIEKRVSHHKYDITWNDHHEDG